MNNWNQLVLGDMGDTYGGLTNKTIVDFGFGKPFIPYMNIFTNGKINPKFLFLVNINPGERQNTVKYGDLFFTTSSETIEEVGMTSVLLDDIGEAYLNSFCFGFRLNNFNDLLPEFAPYLFRGNELRRKISLFGQGSTRYNLPKTELLAKLTIDLPSIPEQRDIAKILSTTDTVIEKTHIAIAKYKAIKQGMLNDLFTRGIDIKTGKLRPKYEDVPEIYKESELGWIPKEWEDCKLGKYIIDSLYGPRFNARDYAENGNVKTIRGTDFTKEGEILYHQAPKALLPNNLINVHKLEDGDIVIVTTADCGLTAVFKKPINDVDFIPSAYSVKYSFVKNVNSFFIKYFMATDCAIRQVNKFVRQGTIGNLPGSDIFKFDIAYPSEDEQNVIAERLLSIDQKIQIEQNYLQKLQQIKSGLMADLLSGRKLVSVSNELETQISN